MKRWKLPKYPLALIPVSVLLGWSVNFTPAAAASSGGVQANGLFADQGPQYMTPQEPTSSQAVTVTLRAAHGNLTSANVVVYDTSTGSTTYYPMTLQGTDENGLYDFWQGTIPASSSIKYYYFQANDGTSSLYYNGSGSSTSAFPTPTFSGDQWNTYDDFVIAPNFTTPTWAQNGIMYQIMVDRFYNGDTSNDVTTGAYSWNGNRTVQLAWGADPELGDPGGKDQVAFFGGDLEGVDQKLPYITKTLGANIVYLNPIFTSPTNHKYDTQDYYNVDPHFGGNSALEQLSSDLHSTTNNAGQEGRLILDGVFNHTSNQNSWFTSAQQNQSSPYYSYYTFTNWPNTYATFAGVNTMPKLNYGSTSLRSQVDNVAKTWLSSPYNIDGWRLDAPGHIGANGYDPESSGNYTDSTNHSYWQEFRNTVKTTNANALIFGEWFEGSQPTEWLNNGNQWDGSVNYNGFLQPVSEWVTGYDDGFNANSINATTMESWLTGTLNAVPRAAQLAQVNELSTQDTPRFGERAAENMNYKTYTQPNGSTFTDPYGGTPNYWKDYLGAFLQFTYVGIPTIYYGDEYGMMGGGTNDAGKRWTFDWSQVANGGNSVFQLYQKLIQLRTSHSALVDGSFMPLVADNATNILAFARFDQNERDIVILNDTDNTETETIPVAQAGAPFGSTLTNITPLVNGASEASTYTVDSHGNINVTVPGHYAMILTQQGSSLWSTPVQNGVYTTQSTIDAGHQTTVVYNGSLAASASSMTLHWGYNGWSGTTNTAMSKQSNGTWTATITVPVGAQTLNTAFYNQSSTWDNNNGSNYNFSVQEVYSSPSPLVHGQTTTIVYAGSLAASASSITMHWGYNGWSGTTDTAMTKQSNGTWTATVTVPTGTVLNTAFYNQAGNWDNNGGQNYNLSIQ
ncbi:alpha-glucosidase [Alicyclobacillus hesperidum]|uniref:Alpha-glucosidase n=1 Tax=Alicyclobacillus hesperidum TaxID=89784 RepID=A0A1H2XIB8_9BACL|nr:alpha amylase N-terminal ig-like domain-containing protein [Alicyclobacillus hesperidum]SDW92611.1 alpha-glucosidase [Alicyclobacillus hesperidum]